MLSRVFTTREQLLMVGSAAAICIGGVAYYIAQPKAVAVEIREVHVPVPQEVNELEPSPSEAILPIAAPLVVEPERRISVSISGAVAAPGVYELSEHDRVEDAIKAAGGATPAGNLGDINKAAGLIDGSALVIPFAGKAGIEDGKRLVLRSGQDAASLNPPEYTISGWRHAARSRAGTATGASAPAPTAASVGSGQLDLNSATAEQLETLPGIGPKLADAIIQYRTRQRFQTVDDLDNVPGFGDKRLADLRPHVRVGP